MPRPSNAFLAPLFSVLLLWLAPSGLAAAAPGDHVWSLGFGADGLVTQDANEEVTAGGGLFGTVDFGGGPITSMAMFTPDVFFAHWDADGNHVWSYGVTPSGGFGGVSVTDLATDAAGNIWIAGRVTDGPIDFGGGVLTGPSLYLLELDSSGNHLFSATFGDGEVNGLAISTAGIALTGNTFASVDFGGGAITSAGNADAWVALLDGSGGHIWSAGFGEAANNQSGNSVVVDASGNVTIAGGMQGTVDFGGGALVAATADTFLAGFDATGTHLFSQVFAGTFAGGSSVFSVYPNLALATDLVMAGEFRGLVDFGGGALSTTSKPDLYIAVFDPATGAHLLSNKHGQDATSEYLTALSLDPSGNIVLSGRMTESIDLGGGPLPWVASGDAWVATFDSTGTFLWNKSFGTVSSELGAGNVVGPSGDILLFGRAGAGIDFGGGPIALAELYLARLGGLGAGPEPPPLPTLGLPGLFGLSALFAGCGALVARQRRG